MGKDIHLIFALPCNNQDELWSEKQKELYNSLLGEADEIIYASENYDPFCMKRRYKYMVEHSAFCIGDLFHEKSGRQTIRFARKKELRIINVAV